MAGVLAADLVVELNLILGALAAALIGLLATSGKVLRDYVKRRGEIELLRLDGKDAQGRPLRTIRERYSDGFTKFAKFHEQVELLKKLDGVERVLVLTGSNCGGIPDPTKEYRVICLHGWAQDPARNPESAYNFKLVVDRPYCLMLAEMVKNGKSVQTFDTMPEMLLKRYYRIEGVVQSIVYLLHLDEGANELMFASFASYTRLFTEREIEVMDVRVDRMRAILTGDDHMP